MCSLHDVRNDRAWGQLALIEFVLCGVLEGVACWLRGGWALDFLQRKITAGTATSISS